MTILAILMPLSSFSLNLITNFEWLEPNNKVEVVAGEPYQLKFSCSDNSLVFTSAYADSWVHIDFTGGQHVVNPPTGYSIDENGVITGMIAGSYAIHPTGWVQAKSGIDKWLYITVVSERSEIESNNTLDTANDITNKIRFGLYNISDIDYFRFTNSNLKWGDEVKFKIHYYGSRENPFGYKWATFCGTNMVGGGSLVSQDQECKALVTTGNTVYLEVYYDQSLSEYFNYGEKFVAEVFINGVPASDFGNDGPNDQQNMIDGHEYVDLGLPSGTLWATTNVGADNPEDKGYYYTWGDIYPYAGGYIFWDGKQYTKYCTAYKYGIPDGKTELEIEDDAAVKEFGDGWRIPSSGQLGELINNCTISKSSLNGKEGCLFTGPNGNSIFLPNTGGCKYGSQPYNNDEAYYWSRNLYYSSDDYAELMVIKDINARIGFGNRDRGLFIRPVVANMGTQPYAVLSDNNTVLTFYYDNQKTIRNGMSVGPIAYDKVNYKPLSEWYGYSSSIKTVVFDDSFADCHDITSTAYWFESFRNLEEIRGLSNLNTENVTDMKRMFIWCSNLTTLDLSNFNTTNVTDMSHMFQQCSSLKNLNLEAFDTKNVVNMHQMFHGCSSITTLDLSHFDTGNVTDMGFMFYQCDNLETLDLSNFNTENVTDMSAFHDCIKLKTIYVNHDWNTEKVSETAFVFYRCYSLEGGQGTKWRDGEIWPIYARIDRGPSAPGYFTKKASQLINGHEYIDLGLPSGKLWAKTNYGASSEGDYGIYMGWTSRHLIQSVWGNEWSTPSQSDILELYNQCAFTWEYNVNSVYGCRVTGPNGNSIFLPAAGFKINGTPQMVGSDIYYWSDNEYESGFAYALQGSAENGFSVYQTWNIELAMFPIRPVANSNGSNGGEDEPHDYVDLALPSGLLWATMNVGANRPEECGSYFAWGETSPKSEYSWTTYKYANGSETTLTKYCNDSSYGNVDYKEVLEEKDDAATANWGKPWRTPTLNETQELINYCSWTLTNQNGVSGYKVTGANGNSIFLPAGGVMQYNWNYFTERSVVMSATTFYYCTSASVLNCQDGAPHWWYGWNRCWGYNVRPVTNTDPNGILKTSMDTSKDIIGIYDIRGHKLDEFHKGINIIKYRNGTSKKIMRKSCSTDPFASAQ